MVALSEHFDTSVSVCGFAFAPPALPNCVRSWRCGGVFIRRLVEGKSY